MIEMDPRNVPSATRRTYYIVALLLLSAPAISYAQSGLVNFNPPPKLPYDATTLEEDDLFRIADSLAGDGFEAAQLQACEDLMSSPNVPFELYRWAFLRRVDLLSYTYREHQAVDILDQWLGTHPDDPNAMGIRITKAEIVGDRGHARFQPTLQMKEDAYDELFQHHQGNDIALVNARMKFVVVLSGYEGRPGIGVERVRGRIFEQLDAAEAALLAIKADSAEHSDTRLANYAQDRLTVVRKVRDRQFDPLAHATPEELAELEREDEESFRAMQEHMLGPSFVASSDSHRD